MPGSSIIMTGNAWGLMAIFQTVTLMMNGILVTGWKKWKILLMMMTIMVRLRVITVVQVLMVLHQATVRLLDMVHRQGTVHLQAMAHLLVTVPRKDMHLNRGRLRHNKHHVELVSCSIR
jgi:hypothetical protein